MKLNSYNNYCFQNTLAQRKRSDNIQTQQPSKPLSFKADPDLIVAGLIAAQAFIGGNILGSYFSPIVKKSNYTPTLIAKNGWNDNVKVLAANSQRYVSMSLSKKNFEKNNCLLYSYYGDTLLYNIKQKDIKSLVDAHNSIGKIVKGDFLPNGFQIKQKLGNHFPQATPNDLNCWNKEDKTKQRFIFAIGGSEERFDNDIKVFSSEISELYDIPESNIIKIENAKKKSVKKGLQKLSEKVKDLNKDNAEILIFYAGHGDVKNGEIIGWSTLFKKEGAATGRTEVGLKEEDLKKFTKEKLNDINTLIIMDTCMSGSWICQ